MNLKRRSFLSVIAAALGASAVTKTAQAQLYTPVPEKWNETVDVLVIGAGGAGFAAAVTAKKKVLNPFFWQKNFRSSAAIQCFAPV